MVIVGRDVVSGLPIEMEITAEVIYAAIKDNLNSICNSIKMILEKTPPELAKDIIHSGIYICLLYTSTLTGKSCGAEERAPMCGIPYHAAETYLTRLVKKGYKVAICEQVEDPKLAKGMVKREVTRVVTPGTTLNAQALDETKNNYICLLYTS